MLHVYVYVKDEIVFYLTANNGNAAAAAVRHTHPPTHTTAPLFKPDLTTTLTKRTWIVYFLFAHIKVPLVSAERNGNVVVHSLHRESHDYTIINT